MAIKDLLNLAGNPSAANDITIKLIAAIIILVLGLVIGRFLSNLVKKILHELELDRVLKEQGRIKVPLTQLISALIKYIIYFVAILAALNQLGLQSFILNIILTVVTLVLIIFMILSLKDFVPNLTAGIYLYQKRSINPGEIIQVNNIEGEVLNITLLETKLRTRNKEIVYIPNSVLMKSVLIKRKIK